jgi:hypothetical protein
MFKKKAHFEDARFELYNLLGEKSLVGTPLLVVGLNRSGLFAAHEINPSYS